MAFKNKNTTFNIGDTIKITLKKENCDVIGNVYKVVKHQESRWVLLKNDGKTESYCYDNIENIEVLESVKDQNKDTSKNIKIGKIIAHARKEKDMSRAELGRIVGLHESTVARYEAGEIKSLSIDKLKEFAKALNIDEGLLINCNTSNNILLGKSITMEFIKKLINENKIPDPDNIPQEIMDLIIDCLKIDIKSSRL